MTFPTSMMLSTRSNPILLLMVHHYYHYYHNNSTTAITTTTPLSPQRHYYTTTTTPPPPRLGCNHCSLCVGWAGTEQCNVPTGCESVRVFIRELVALPTLCSSDSDDTNDGVASDDDDDGDGNGDRHVQERGSSNSSVSSNSTDDEQPTIITQLGALSISTSTSTTTTASDSNVATAGTAGTVNASIRVMTYNVLADCYALPQWFPACPERLIRFTFRSRRIIDEIRHYQPDVACLQEVDHWDDFYRDALHSLGYDSKFASRPGRLDGCATIWQRTKYVIKQNNRERERERERERVRVRVRESQPSVDQSIE
jgi:hypothetical protein